MQFVIWAYASVDPSPEVIGNILYQQHHLLQKQAKQTTVLVRKPCRKSSKEEHLGLETWISVTKIDRRFCV